MSKFLSVTLLAGASAIAALVPIQAKALPLALWGDGSRVFVNTVGSQNVDYGGFTFGTISAGGADGNASVVSAPAPVPSIIATAQYIHLFSTALSAAAVGDFWYYGEVYAPGGIVDPVNLNVTANGSLYSESGSFSTSVSHDTLKVNTATIVDADSTNGSNNGDFTISTTISGSVILTNQPYLIHMTATGLRFTVWARRSRFSIHIFPSIPASWPWATPFSPVQASAIAWPQPRRSPPLSHFSPPALA